MKFEVTRNVVSDLWPLCRSGEASTDSKTLVESFLSADPSFATTLQNSARMPGILEGVRLSPDAELRLLQDARQRARMKLLLIGGGIGLLGILAVVSLVGVLFLIGRGF